MKNAFFLISFLFAGCGSLVVQEDPCLRLPASAELCDAVFAEPQIRYAKGYEKPGRHLQFGFESEYLPSEAGALLDLYIPDPDITRVQPDEWLAMPLNKRNELIAEYENKLFPYREPGRMTLVTQDPKLRATLPRSLVYDGGKYEIILSPRDTLETLLSEIRLINDHFGTGSMQLTVSAPRPEKTSPSEARNSFERGTLGHLNFVNEKDTLEKLNAGFEKYQEDPGTPAASSFAHPWLGPMTKVKQALLRDRVRGIARGEEVSRRNIEEISTEIGSSKFIGGVAFRPDVAAADRRVAFEIRHCHKSMGCLESVARRETEGLQHGYPRQARFAGNEAFDSIRLFDSLPPRTRKLLKKLFPEFGDHNRVEVQIYRNFAFPLKDWAYLTAANPSLQRKVSTAQQNYLKQLEAIEAAVSRKRISEDEARLQVMGALAEFPSASGLLEAVRQLEN